MSKWEKIRTEVLNIQPEEARSTGYMWMLSFSIGFTLIFYTTQASALFFAAFDIEFLPYVFIMAAVIAVVIGSAYSRLLNVIAIRKQLLLTYVLILVSLITFFVGTILFPSKGLTLAMFVWKDVIIALFGMVYWTLASNIFNLRQGKRLFGLIETGKILSGIICGGTTPLMVGFFGTNSLLLLSAIGSVATLVLLYTILKVIPGASSSGSTSEETNKAATISGVFKQRYLVLYFSMGVLSLIGYYQVDYLFFEQVETIYKDEEAIASFIGVFLAILAISTFIMNAFFSGRLLARFGISVGIIAVPTTLLIGLFVLALIGTFLDWPMVFFGLILTIKLFDDLLRVSLEYPTQRVLYQPLPIALRLKTQTLSEGFMGPVSSALSGILLLFFTTVLKVDIVTLTYIVAGGFVICIFFAVLVKREYGKVLLKALKQRQFEGRQDMTLDPTSIEIIQKSLSSTSSGEVIYALDTLETTAPEVLDEELAKLLNHPNSEVRIEAMRRLDRLKITAAVEVVKGRLHENEAPKVQGTALKTLMALGGGTYINTVVPFLTHEKEALRLGAMVGLLRSGGIQGILKAGVNLLEKMKAPDPKDRQFAAKVIGEVGISDFYEQLIPLLEDADPAVKEEALHTAEVLKNPLLWQAVADNLELDQVRTPAAAALIAGGTTALNTLELAFEKEGQTNKVKRAIVEIMGQIKGDRVISFLVQHFHPTNKELFHQILSSLSACAYKRTSAELGTTLQIIEQEVNDYKGILSNLVLLKDKNNTTFLKQALRGKLRIIRNNILLLLSFQYDSETVLRVQYELNHPTSTKKASAMEVLDNLLPQEIKRVIFPILDELTDSQRLDLLNKGASANGAIYNLNYLYQKGQDWQDEWLMAYVLYTAAKHKTELEDGHLTAALSHPSSIVQETANYISSTMKGQSAVELPLATIEKIAIIKQTTVFADLPEDLLTSLLDIAEELPFEAGASIVQEGEMSASMYILLEGAVKQTKGGHEIKLLGPGGYFEMLSLIDGEPYWSTCIATTSGKLLRFDQAAFRQIRLEQPAIAGGIIQDLCRQYRLQLALPGAAPDEIMDLNLSPEDATPPAELSREMLPIEKRLLLKKVGLFRNLPDEILTELSDLLADTKKSAGTVLIQEGKMGKALYIIASGKVKVSQQNKLIAYLGERSFFGELALLDEELQPLTITAIEPVQLLEVKKETFERLLNYHPEVADNAIHILALRLRILLDELWQEV